MWWCFAESDISKEGLYPRKFEAVNEPGPYLSRVLVSELARHQRTRHKPDVPAYARRVFVAASIQMLARMSPSAGRAGQSARMPVSRISLRHIVTSFAIKVATCAGDIGGGTMPP